MLSGASLDQAFLIPSKVVSVLRDEVNQLNKIVDNYESSNSRMGTIGVGEGYPASPNRQLAPQPPTQQTTPTPLYQPHPVQRKRDANKEAIELIDKLMENPVVINYIRQKVSPFNKKQPTKSLKETFIGTYNDTVGCTDIKGYLTVFLLIITIYLGVSLFLDYIKSKKVVSTVPMVSTVSPMMQGVSQVGVTKNLF